MKLDVYLRAALAGAIALAAAGVGDGWAAEPLKRFRFVAMGDMPYSPAAHKRFQELIAAINETKPAFSIHIGDLKGGGTPCGTEIDRARRYFDLFEYPLVYSPGDTDWTDCHRRAAGGFDTRERLAYLRERFFPGPESLGMNAMPLVRQSDTSEFNAMVENARWEWGGIVFATVHLVGRDNNIGRDRQEFRARDEANVAWIDAAFARAIESDSHGLVLAYHADMFGLFTGKAGFVQVLAAIASGAEAFARPVLLIHGDSHVYRVDKPLRAADTGNTLENVTRLQVFGAEDVRAVQITLDPENPALFGFEPLDAGKK